MPTAPVTMSHQPPPTSQQFNAKTEGPTKAETKMQKAFDEITKNIQQLIDLLAKLMQAFQKLEDAGKTEDKKDDQKAMQKIGKLFEQMGKEVEDITQGIDKFSEALQEDSNTPKG